MERAVDFIKFLRPHFLLGGLGMNILGAALATHAGFSFDFGDFLWIQLIISSIQLGGQTANEYADAIGDALNRNRTWFSGGSGITSSGKIRKNTVRNVTLFLVATAIVSGAAFFLFVNQSLILLAIIFIAMILALEYSLGPMKMENRGMGEIAMAFTVGLLCPVASYLAQGGIDAIGALPVTIVTFLLTFSLLIMIEFPDYEADRDSGKRNLIVRMGRPAVWTVGLAALVVGAVIGLLMPIFGFPILLSISITSIFLADAVILSMVRSIKVSGSGTYGWLTASAIGMFAIALVVSSLALF